MNLVRLDFVVATVPLYHYLTKVHQAQAIKLNNALQQMQNDGSMMLISRNTFEKISVIKTTIAVKR